MADLRGRPYAFIVLTVAFWISARMAWPESGGTGTAIAPVQKAYMPQPIVARAVTTSPDSLRSAQNQLGQIQHARTEPVRTRKYFFKQHGLPPALVPWQVGGRPSGLSVPLRVAGDDKPLSAGRDTPPTIAHALAGKAGPPELLRQKRWQVYAYSFWRASRPLGPSLGPNAQYGGSQSGMIATFDPVGSPDRGIGLLIRGSVTPVRPAANAHELAVGFRWRPMKHLPLTLSAERRFRERSADGFAAYMAGGIDSVPLPKGWKLDAYGQMGYATGQSSGGFFDGQARVLHRLTDVGKTPISVGVGGWAGGQKGAYRVDVGPAIVAKIDAGPGAVLVQLDWRLRVAGNAEPKNGLALTVSSGF